MVGRALMFEIILERNFWKLGDEKWKLEASNTLPPVVSPVVVV
jgi:hypothetical protein